MTKVNNNLFNIKNNQKTKLATTALTFLMSLTAAQAEAAEDNITKLSPIVVKEKKDVKNQGYHGGKTVIGKFSQSAKDVPQSLTIINRNLIEDRNAISLKEALRNVAGLTFNAAEGGRIGDNITIRGFGASSDLYLDGMRDNAQYNRDTFNIEKVEVLRGAASMVFGRGSTGGVVNQVSKEPALDLNSSVSVTAGTQSFLRETADLNQNISDTAAIRLNLMKTDSESNRDYVSHDSIGVAPSIKFGIGTDNELLLAYSHLQYDDIPDFGIPIPNVQNSKPIAVPNDTFYGFPKVDYQKDSADVFTARLNHKIDNDSEVILLARKSMVERDLRATTASYNLTSGLITRGRQARGAQEDTSTLQANYVSKFEAFKMKHELLAGAEYLDEKASRWGYFSSTPLNNPATTALYPDNFTLPNNYGATYQRINPIHFKDSDIGLYAQDIIEFIPNWKLLLGARYDDFHAEYDSTTTATGASVRYERRDRVWSYRSGLMYQPNNKATYYASYGTSFNPSGDLYAIEALTSSNAAKTDPEKSINAEIGAKWELFNDKLSLRTAIFRSEKTNERNTDQTNTSVTLLSGKRHTDGIEFEATGHVTNNWEIFGGVAFMKAEIDKHVNPNGVGLKPVNTPSVSGNFWNTYKITKNWKIGAGADFVGERLGYSISQNSTNGVFTAPTIRRVPGYVRFDGLLQWDNKQYSAKLNVFNLLDREYFDSIYPNGGWGVPGTNRAAQLTVTYKF